MRDGNDGTEISSGCRLLSQNNGAGMGSEHAGENLADGIGFLIDPDFDAFSLNRPKRRHDRPLDVLAGAVI